MPHVPPTYCVCDIETNGPTPGIHALLSVAFAAFGDDEQEIGTFEATLVPPAGTDADVDTMAWWATEPEAWAAATHDPRPAEEVIPSMVAWLERLPAPRVFLAHPLAFDGVWIDAYLRAFGSRQLFALQPDRSPFAGGGIDIGTYVHATFGMPVPIGVPSYPDVLRNGAPHDHTPLTDARGHAATFFNARRLGRDAASRARVREAFAAPVSSERSGSTG